tara:strand:+ start:3085 stop:3300 length:216 start_codon:yes stop_codon:yes gene_type:complete
MKSFSQIIEMWPTAEVFGADIGIAGHLARKWKARNTLPSRHWNTVVEKARERGIDVSLHILADVAERRQAA